MQLEICVHKRKKISWRLWQPFAWNKPTTFYVFSSLFFFLLTNNFLCPLFCHLHTTEMKKLVFLSLISLKMCKGDRKKSLSDWMVSLYNPIGSPRYKVYWLLPSVTETKISQIINDIYYIWDKTITSLVITIPNWFLIVFCYLMLIALTFIWIFFTSFFSADCILVW
jgi:hypothetical protein